MSLALGPKLLLIGPPGAGKTMFCKRLPTILPARDSPGIPHLIYYTFFSFQPTYATTTSNLQSITTHLSAFIGAKRRFHKKRAFRFFLFFLK
ncbi:MAG: ATP-binding protein [Planctomycetota bacterium]